MTAKEMRKLLGKEITFRANGWDRRGMVLEVGGRNVRVGGFSGWDWYWIPDLRGVQVVGDMGFVPQPAQAKP